MKGEGGQRTIRLLRNQRGRSRRYEDVREDWRQGDSCTPFEAEREEDGELGIGKGQAMPSSYKKGQGRRIIYRAGNGRFRKTKPEELGIGGVCPNCNSIMVRIYEGDPEARFMDPAKYRNRCFTCDPATYGGVDDDVRVDYFRHSGQGVNEDSRCVRVTHVPTGIYVDSKEHVTRHENVVLAMKKLDEQIAELCQKEMK